MKRPSLRFLRSRRFWQRTVFAFVCFVSLVAVFYLVENYRGRAAWELYRSEAQARGVKLYLHEFVSPPIPDEENFAAIPILAELKSSERSGQSSLPHGAGAPPLGDGRNGRPVDLAVWQKYFVKEGFVPAASDNAAADVLAALERYEPMLAQLREAASRTRSRLAGWEKGADADLFALRGHLNLSKTLSLRVAALIALGRTEDALADWRVMHRLATMFQSEPTLLAGMLHSALLHIALDCAWRGLATGQWTHPELVELPQRLEGFDHAANYRFALGSERAFTNSTFLEPMKSIPWTKRAAYWERRQGGADARLKWLALLPEGWISQNQVRLNRWFDRHIETIDAPPHERSQAAADMQKIVVSPAPYTFIVASAFYGFGGSLDIMRELQTDLQLFRAACALERFRLRTGAYPPALEDLTPREFTAVPADAFEQPFGYRREDGDGVVVYSTGKDGRDEGGEKGDDLHWRSPPRAEPASR